MKEDNINEILGLVEEDKENKPIVKQEFSAPVTRKENNDNDIDNDYEYSRDSYYNLIEKGQQAIEGILQVAQEGEHPRAYEVAGNLIKSVADTVDKLQDLQKKLKDLKEVPKSANTQIKNALFVGSTNELQKMLRQNETIEGEVTPPKETDI